MALDVEVVREAKEAFRRGEYACARTLISGRPKVSPGCEDALRAIDMCSAKLLGDASELPSRPRDEADLASDDAVYYRAFYLWLRGDFGFALDTLRAHRAVSETGHAASLLLQGWIHAAQLDFVAQRDLTIAALAILRDQNDADPFLLANGAQALATVARDMPTARTRAVLDALATEIDRGPYAQTALHVRRALALHHGLHGEYVVALKHLTIAGGSAASALDRAFLNFDYALIASWAKQNHAARAAFATASEQLRGIELMNRADEGAFVLTVGAIAGAEIENAAASELAQQARATVPTMSPRWAATHGPRAEAFIYEALALTTADAREATGFAISAMETFERLGFEWRAGRLALRLYHLTGRGSHRANAARFLREYDDGPFAVEAMTLPPRLREVLAHLQHGRRIEQIAQAMEVSPNTVRVHIRRLHQIYGVRGRAELLARVQTG